MEDVDPDVILNNIIPCLDGPTLASVSCASTTLRHLISSNSHHLWAHICHATWPSLDTPRLRHIISTFPPDGPRSFFSRSYAPHQPLISGNHHNHNHLGLTELIWAVDIRFKGNVIFSRTVETAETETETETRWFRCAPFRVDLVDQKEVVQMKPTGVKHPMTDDEIGELYHDMTLSWILVDPVHSRATNLAGTGQPVSVQRHWLSGEAIVDFCSVIDPSPCKKGAEMVKCGIRVTLGGSGELSLVMEDMDGKHLNGEGSLVILECALECSNKGRRYEEFLEMRQERKEREVRWEKMLDSFCVGFGVTLLASFLMFFFFNSLYIVVCTCF